MGKKTDARNACATDASGKSQRRRTTDQFAESDAGSRDVLYPEAARRMLNELQLQKTQLEIVNEQLRRTQSAMEASHARYFDFYNRAPVGYLTLTPTGTISEANQTISAFLGISREILLRSSIDQFLSADDHEQYCFCAKQLFEDKKVRKIELRMRKGKEDYIWMRLDMALAQDDSGESAVQVVATDITERKNAETKQQETAEIYRQLFEMEADALFLVDHANGKIIDANLAAVNLYGYSREEFFLMKNVDISAEPEKTDKFISTIEQKGAMFVPLRYHRKKDGTVFPVEINATYLLHKGRPSHIPAIRDITGRTTAEEKQRRNSEIQTVLREIAEAAIAASSMDALYSNVHQLVNRVLPAKNFHINLLDKETNEIVVPFRVNEINFIPKRRPTGKGLTEHILQQCKPVHLTPADMERLRATGEYTREKAQKVKICQALGAPLIDSKGEAFGVITLALTDELQSFQPGDIEVVSIIAAQVSQAIEKKKAEAALAKSETQLRTLVETIPDLIWLKDVEGVYLSCNKMFENFFGAKETYIVGKTDYDFLDRKLADFFRVNDRVAMEAGKPSINEELLSFASDGSQALMETIKTPLLDVDGKLVGVLGIARDITERKHMETMLRRNTEVQQVVRKIAEAALVSVTLDELYSMVQRLVNGLLPAKNFHINLLDETQEQILAPYYIDETNVIPAQRPLRHGLSEYVMRQGRTVHLTAAELTRLRDTGEATSSFEGVLEWMGAPLIDSTGKVYGVIVLYSGDEEQHFYPEDSEIITIIAAQVSQAIEKKKADDALRSSEKRFRQLIKTLPVPLTIFNSLDELAYINDRFVQVFGYSQTDIPSRAAWREQAFPDEEYRNWVATAWADAVLIAKSKEQDIEPIECSIICKNGMARSVIVTGIVLEEEVLATFTDITERRRHENAMKKYYERRRRTELMNELTKGSSISSQKKLDSARALGIRVMKPFTFFLIVLDEYQGKPRAYWQEQVDEYQLCMDAMLDALDDDHLISWESPEGIGVLSFEFVSSEKCTEEQKLIAEQLRNRIGASIPEATISIGIAEPAVNIADIAERCSQAFTAVSAGSKVWPQLKTYHYLDMGVFQLLSCFGDEAQVAEYIDRTIGKLLNYDKRKNGAFLDTLEVILMSDNLKEGADKLSIHYQTLMFRKQRLENILEVSFEDFSSRMAILTALHLLKLQRN